MATNEEIARGFVLEYLDRSPEFLDVAEFADDKYPSDPDEEILYGTVYDEVVAILDTIAQRYLDEEI